MSNHQQLTKLIEGNEQMRRHRPVSWHDCDQCRWISRVSSEGLSPKDRESPIGKKKLSTFWVFFLEKLVIVCRECDLRLYLSHRINTTHLTRAKCGFEKTTSYLTKDDNAKLVEIGLRTGSCSLLVFNLMDEPSASKTINANEIASWKEVYN